MNYRHLIALFVPLAFALPSIAAEPWPADAKAEFVKECVAGAPDGHATNNLTAYCECAAEKVSNEFSEADMQAMARQSPPDSAMQQRLIKASASCENHL
ncbi:hypothetical protein [Pseudomonas sp. EA_35y_Pfl2_R111]|uniref:hypothetical protein n=1 Tax=Pseudomonas sp. EA_35y_Pfl2_R111 TaxID=3088689 RepID=UPI0030D96ACE